LRARPVDRNWFQPPERARVPATPFESPVARSQEFGAAREAPANSVIRMVEDRAPIGRANGGEWLAKPQQLFSFCNAARGMRLRVAGCL
jgi:hypothetical protein